MATERETLELRKQRLNTELLEAAAASDVPILSEHIFVHVFLPFFANDKNPLYPVKMDRWLQVAGNPYRAVNIVDQAGTVLFQVPPVSDRSAVAPMIVADGRAGLAHVVQSAGQMAMISPRMAEQHLEAEFTKRALIMSTPANVMANLTAWNAIFKRYNRPEILHVEPEPVPGAVPAKPAVYEDDFEPL